MQRRLAVLECGFLLFSVSGNAVAGVSFLAVELVYKWAFSFSLDKVFRLRQ